MLHRKDMKKTIVSFVPQNRVVSFSGIRREHLGFLNLCVMYYILVTFIASWSKEVSIGKDFPTISFGSLILTISTIAASVCIYVFQVRWLIHRILVSIAILTIFSVILFLFPNAFWLWLGIIVGIALGCAHVSIIIPFVFTINNTEKFYVTTLGSMVMQVVILYKKRFVIEGYFNFADRLFEMLLLLSFLIIIILRRRYFVVEQEPKVSAPLMSRICLTWIFNGVFVVICLGVIRGFLRSAVTINGSNIYLYHYLGGLIGCLTYMALYIFCKKAVILIGNVTFGSIALGILCYAFADLHPSLAMAFSAITGIGWGMGMINVCYIITVVAKKYHSMRYLSLSILWIGTVGGIVSLIINMVLQGVNNRGSIIVASIISAAFLLLFMLVSPLMAEKSYYNDWAKDSEEMDIKNGQCNIYEQYHLSKREVEVIELLLEGYTLRQIAAILSLAYSTINTYYTSAYRKLNINSRVQLLLLFKDYENKS